MIGIKAIPARNGGFETAVDEISRGVVRLGHEVVVYNRSGMSEQSGTNYEGVRLVALPTLRSKNLSTIVHAFLSTLHVIFHRVDVVHYFIAGTTLFAPIPRLLGMNGNPNGMHLRHSAVAFILLTLCPPASGGIPATEPYWSS